MLQKFIIAETIFISIIDKVLNEDATARTCIPVDEERE